jgi:Fe-S-cluster containining protein
MNSIEKGQLGKFMNEIDKIKKVITPTQHYFLQSILFLQSHAATAAAGSRSMKFMFDLKKLNEAQGKLYCNECNEKECCYVDSKKSNERCIFFDNKKMKCSVYAIRPLHCRLWVCERFSKEDIANICQQLDIMKDMYMIDTNTFESSKIT